MHLNEERTHQRFNNQISLFNFILILTTLLVLFLCLSGCIPKGIESKEGKPIKIGINIWPGYAHAFIALYKGFFKNNGVNVELVLCKEYSESQNLYMNGDVDGIFGVFADVIIYNSQGIKTKVVYISDYSESADVIIADPIYSSLVDLKDKKIGIESINSFSHLFVLEVFEKAGISEVDLQFEIVPSQQILRALEENKVEAGHTWNPMKAAALNKGYKVVGKAGDVPGIITDVLSFNSKIIEERPADILAIVKSMSEAKNYLDENMEDALQIMAMYESISIEEMKQGINEIYQLNLQDNLSATKPSKEITSLYGSGAIISEFYLNRGQLMGMPDFNEIIDSSFINKIFEVKLK